MPPFDANTVPLDQLRQVINAMAGLTGSEREQYGLSPADIQPNTGTADLESRIGPARDVLGEALQARQNPMYPLGPDNPSSSMNPVVSGGPVKRGLSHGVLALLSNFGSGLATVGRNFAQGAAQAGLEASGAAAYQKMQADTQESLARAHLYQQQADMLSNSVEVTDPTTGATFRVPANKGYDAFIKLLQEQGRNNRLDRTLQNRTDLANLNEGLSVPVPVDIAQQIGMPGIAGKRLGRSSWQSINAALASQGKDLTITDVGDRRVLMRKSTGDVLRDLGQAPAYTAGIARMHELGNVRAETTPFATFDENGMPTTTTVAEAIRNGYPAASVWNTIFGPTGATKSQAQAAGAVAEHIPTFKQSIDKLAARGELGPVMGRLNSYLTEGYGGNDPDVSEFVTTVGLLKSGAVRAHFGARGGAQILDKFDNYLNTAQTPEALKGSIDAISSFLNTYKAVGTANPPHTNITPRGGNIPKGWK